MVQVVEKVSELCSVMLWFDVVVVAVVVVEVAVVCSCCYRCGNCCQLVLFLFVVYVI